MHYTDLSFDAEPIPIYHSKEMGTQYSTVPHNPYAAAGQDDFHFYDTQIFIILSYVLYLMGLHNELS